MRARSSSKRQDLKPGAVAAENPIPEVHTSTLQTSQRQWSRGSLLDEKRKVWKAFTLYSIVSLRVDASICALT